MTKEASPPDIDPFTNLNSGDTTGWDSLSQFELDVTPLTGMPGDGAALPAESVALGGLLQIESETTSDRIMESATYGTCYSCPKKLCKD